MGQVKRFKFGAGVLLALVGLGAQYMTTGFYYLGLGTSMLGIVILTYQFWDDLSRLRLVLISDVDDGAYTFPSKEFLFALVTVFLALGLTWYVFLSSRSSSPVFNDMQAQVGALRGRLSSQRVTKRNEFIRALREMGPATLDIYYISGDRNAADLFGDLYYLVIAGGWTIRERGVLNTTPWVGVRIVVKDKNLIPSGAALMKEMLTQNGIVTGLIEREGDSSLTPTLFVLEVGYRS